MRCLGVIGLGLSLSAFAMGCANGSTVAPATPATAPPPTDDAAVIATDGPRPDTGVPVTSTTSTTWIGASGEGDLLAAGTRDTVLGVWVDVPETRPTVRPPMDLAVVIDTSGSMAGAKIENARNAATTLVKSLKDGDIVSLDTFSDNAKTLIPSTRINAESRASVLKAIAGLTPTGSTNMFDGLTLGEGQLAGAPQTHTVRRVVMISDGIANVGPSSPDTLGSIAERGLKNRAQVTSLGVGNDYDEKTLNALAVKSSGRLYHLTEPKEMASILKGELDLLNATLASDAFVEVTPAPGVQLVGADGIRADWAGDGALRIPLGALHSGQHREALVRVRLTDPESFTGQSHPLASVRLRFRDAQDSGVERMQEVIARTQLTTDSNAVATSKNSRTQAIVAIQETAKIEMAAAQRFNDGRFDDADKELAVAEETLAQQAQVVKDAAGQHRIAEAQKKVAGARAAARAAPSKPKAAQRQDALELNAQGMSDFGF